nr:hypothetical protein [Desulfobacterales bacterium]
MDRTRLEDQLILTFLGLLLIIMLAVGVVHRITNDFYIAHAISIALAMGKGLFPEVYFLVPW